MKIPYLMKKKHNTLLLVTAIITLLLLLIGYICIFFYINKENSKLYTFDIVASEDYSIDVNLKITRSWCNVSQSGKVTEGAQYDASIINKSNHDFSDWKLTIFLEETSTIDSIWYGKYKFPSKKKLVIYPDESNNIVESNNDKTFGFVMTSEHLQFVDHYLLEGYYHIVPTDILTFNILLGLSILWIFLFLLYILLFSKTSVYDTKVRHNRKIIIQAMKTFSGFIDAKDAYTKGHSSRVADYTKMLCQKLNLSASQIEDYYYIALLHDCGKIGIPDNILNKPGKLTPQERKIIESHTTIGGQVLSDFTAIKGIIEGATYHHERYDGKGYPEGLAGTDIPYIARIICVADSFDAMNSNRCYRKKLEKEIILNELKTNSGKQFDPEIVKYMIELIEEDVIHIDD